MIFLCSTILLLIVSPEVALADGTSEAMTIGESASAVASTMGGVGPGLGKLASQLKTNLDANEYLVVVIGTESETRYGRFLEVLSEVHEAGAKRIAILPIKKVSKKKAVG